MMRSAFKTSSVLPLTPPPAPQISPTVGKMKKVAPLELPAGHTGISKQDPPRYRDPSSTDGASVFQLLAGAKDGSQ